MIIKVIISETVVVIVIMMMMMMMILSLRLLFVLQHLCLCICFNLKQFSSHLFHVGFLLSFGVSKWQSIEEAADINLKVAEPKSCWHLVAFLHI